MFVGEHEILLRQILVVSSELLLKIEINSVVTELFQQEAGKNG